MFLIKTYILQTSILYNPYIYQLFFIPLSRIGVYYHLISNHSYEHGREASGGKTLWISSYRNDCVTSKRKMEFNYKKAKQKYEVVHLVESDKGNKVFLSFSFGE